MHHASVAVAVGAHRRLIGHPPPLALAVARHLLPRHPLQRRPRHARDRLPVEVRDQVELSGLIGGHLHGLAGRHTCRQRSDPRGRRIVPRRRAHKPVNRIEVEVLGIHLQPPGKLHRLPRGPAAAEDRGADGVAGDLRGPRELKLLRVGPPDLRGAVEHALPLRAQPRHPLLIERHWREGLGEIARSHPPGRVRTAWEPLKRLPPERQRRA